MTKWILTGMLCVLAVQLTAQKHNIEGGGTIEGHVVDRRIFRFYAPLAEFPIYMSEGEFYRTVDYYVRSMIMNQPFSTADYLKMIRLDNTIVFGFVVKYRIYDQLILYYPTNTTKS